MLFQCVLYGSGMGAEWERLGGDWRMPTWPDMQELVDLCTWEWTNQNNVNGYRVVGPNGNTIFLPAGGARYESELHDVGTNGLYWTSSLRRTGPTGAQYLYFYSAYHGVSYLSRYFGIAVRPVRARI